MICRLRKLDLLQVSFFLSHVPLIIIVIPGGRSFHFVRKFDIKCQSMIPNSSLEFFIEQQNI